MSDTWTIFTDGGSRGNPGPAAYAYVIKRPGVADIEEKGYLGHTTNNIAEYTGLVKALEHAKELGAKKLLVNSDSELMVKQMNGQYKVKNEGLRPLYTQATALRKHFDSVVIKHIYREQNSEADALCNQAMDNESEPSRVSGRPDPGEPSRVSGRVEAPAMTPLMQALDLLEHNAMRWADGGDANNPPPAQILNQLLEILRRNESSAAD